jgi:hypothetical protein
MQERNYDSVSNTHLGHLTFVARSSLKLFPASVQFPQAWS